MHRRLKIGEGISDWLIGDRITHRLQIIKMAVSVAGFTFRSIAEQSGDVRMTFDIRYFGEIQVAAISLTLTCKRVF
jgi:hypothetical protein